VWVRYSGVGLNVARPGINKCATSTLVLHKASPPEGRWVLAPQAKNNGPFCGLPPLRIELADFRPRKRTHFFRKTGFPSGASLFFWTRVTTFFLNLRHESCLDSKYSRRIVESYLACTGKATRVTRQRIEGFYGFLAPQVDPPSKPPRVGMPLVALVVSQVHISGFRLALICSFIVLNFLAQLKLVSEIYLF